MTASRLTLTGILILALVAVPLAVEAQQARVYRIGVILQGGPYYAAIDGQFSDLTAKRLDLLKEMIPRLRRVVTFYSPDNPAARRSVTIARDAARQLKVELVERPVASVEEMQAGLRALQPGEADAFFFVSDAMVNSQEELIIDTARAKRLPTMLPYKGRSEEHTSELQSLAYLVCRLLLEKKN